MNAEELVDVKRKLRDFTSSNGMQWVLDEVDEAVSLGIPEVRTLRQSSRQGQITYEDITGEDLTGIKSGGRRGRAEEFVTRRPMTELEQVELLVQALRRVLVDLDEIANESVNVLNDPTLGDQPEASTLIKQENIQTNVPPRVNQISFAPDEGSSSSAIDTETVRLSDRSIRASEVLAQIEGEIRS